MTAAAANAQTSRTLSKERSFYSAGNPTLNQENFFLLCIFSYSLCNAIRDDLITRMWRLPSDLYKSKPFRSFSINSTLHIHSFLSQAHAPPAYTSKASSSKTKSKRRRLSSRSHPSSVRIRQRQPRQSKRTILLDLLNLQNKNANSLYLSAMIKK